MLAEYISIFIFRKQKKFVSVIKFQFKGELTSFLQIILHFFLFYNKIKFSKRGKEICFTKQALDTIKTSLSKMVTLFSQIYSSFHRGEGAQFCGIFCSCSLRNDKYYNHSGIETSRGVAIFATNFFSS